MLEYKLKDKFEAFGTVYVKIKRDHRGMPYAFCQFEVSQVVLDVFVLKYVI